MQSITDNISEIETETAKDGTGEWQEEGGTGIGRVVLATFPLQVNFQSLGALTTCTPIFSRNIN